MKDLEINQGKGVDILLIFRKGYGCVLPENERRLRWLLHQCIRQGQHPGEHLKMKSLRRDGIPIKRTCPKRKNKVMTWKDTMT